MIIDTGLLRIDPLGTSQTSFLVASILFLNETRTRNQ